MSVQGSVIPTLAPRKPRICIAVPTKDMMHSHFAYCLQELVAYNMKIGLDTVVEFNMGTLVCNQREKLANKAIELGATHIMWLDSDMMFPKDVVEKLLGHNLPFVACNYSTRTIPFKAVAYTQMEDWNSSIDKETNGLISVEAVGLGCALIDVDLFEEIRKPWFAITYSAKSDDYLGEDMNFCRKVVECGSFIAVDGDLSKKIYHIGSAAFLWNSDPVDTNTAI